MTSSPIKNTHLTVRRPIPAAHDYQKPSPMPPVHLSRTAVQAWRGAGRRLAWPIAPPAPSKTFTNGSPNHRLADRNRPVDWHPARLYQNRSRLARRSQKQIKIPVQLPDHQNRSPVHPLNPQRAEASLEMRVGRVVLGGQSVAAIARASIKNGHHNKLQRQQTKSQ